MLNRSPDLRLPEGDCLPATKVRCSDKHGEKNLPLTVAGQWRTFTAFPSIQPLLVIDTFLCRYSAAIRMLDVAHLGNAVGDR
jgi:hypothetical protein